TGEFNCGKSVLNKWLDRYALQAMRSGNARTFVVAQGLRIVGYYALASGSVENMEASDRVRRGMPRHPIPVVLLARLAVDSSFQGKGIGAGLLHDAMLRTLRVADEVGIRALLVHAKDDHACKFYERHDFESSPSDPYHLTLLIKDIKDALSEHLATA